MGKLLMVVLQALAVGELGVECVNLVAQIDFSRAQVGHAGAQFFDALPNA